MKSFRLCCAFVLGCGFFAAAHAADFEAALSQDTAQFTFRSDSSVIGWGGADLALGLFYNDESDFILDGSLMQMRQASEENPLTFGVGVKGYVGNIDVSDESLLALAIGGEVRYTIPGTMPMAVYGRAFYAPDITSFSDSENVLDYTFGFQIEVLPQTTAFIGYRRFEIETDDLSDYRADDDNIHIGVRLTF